MAKVGTLLVPTVVIGITITAFIAVPPISPAKVLAGASGKTKGHFNTQGKCVGNPHDTRTYPVK